MRKSIDLMTNADLESRYKALLAGDWEPLLGNALQLLDDQLRQSGIQLILPWDATVDLSDESNVLRIPNALVEEVLPLLQRLHSHELPPVPEGVLEKQDRLPERYRAAIRVAVCLTLQAQFELYGEDGLFRDIQSLIFLGTVYELLPKLNSARLREVHDLLVNILAYHCTVIWRDYAAHQQYLLGILAGYSKDEELEEKSLVASFHLTSPDEHDYLTKAQVCVFHFLEHRRYDKAKSFLFAVCRQAPEESLDELRKMLDDVYAARDLSGRSKGGKTRR
jgi:hypothetical protein